MEDTGQESFNKPILILTPLSRVSETPAQYAVARTVEDLLTSTYLEAPNGKG